MKIFLSKRHAIYTAHELHLNVVFASSFTVYVQPVHIEPHLSSY